MPIRKSKQIEAELLLNKKIDELTKIYRAAQKAIKAELDSLDITDFQKSRSEGILRQVNQILHGLNSKAHQWSMDVAPYAYRRGFNVAGDELKGLDVTKSLDFGARIHTSAVAILADDIAVDLVFANQSISKNINRFIRVTQQNILQDKEISSLIAQGVVQGETRRTVSNTLLEEFRKRLQDEQFITINGRNFRPDKYAELIARTRTREASSQGTVNTALQYGVDLVQWSVHSQSCPICERLQGKIFSISGSNQDFPQLDNESTPPAHPNCEHVILPVTEEALKIRGIYNDLSNFSLRTDRTTSFSDYEEAIA